MKSEFLTELDLRDLDDKDSVLLSELKYRSEMFNCEITVPKGFVTDKSSVPRVPIVYMLFGDRSHREGVLHDFLYRTHSVPKWKADLIFLEAMKSRKKSVGVRWPMYLGTFFGGYSSYRTGKKRFKILPV